MPELHIATLPGALRAGSFNRKLLKIAEPFLEQAGVELDRLDLRDFPLPLYDGDWETEHGLPLAVQQLKERIRAADGIVIASPEYNWSIPGTLKNAIDWTSRGGKQPWAGKVVGLMGVSNGPWGTQRGMPHLRQSLLALSALVIPQQINVPMGGEVWDEAGNLKDEKLPGRVEKFITAFLDVTRKLRG